jgi:DNA-binding CsgD family transcriptional regulator
MLTGKRVVIVSTNQLLCVGLRTILTDCFSVETVGIYTTFGDFTLDHSVDYVFVHPDTFVLNHDLFDAFPGKAIVMMEHEPHDASFLPSALNITFPEADMIEQLRTIFSRGPASRGLHAPGSLTSREIDVLKLVARGQLNKQIADRLSISLHTVISHRKNITRKLGIKTVSGLTMYAVLNGLISSRDIH